MPHAHVPASARPVRFFVLTVSTSRAPAQDASGDRIVALVEAAGYVVVGRTLVADGVGSVGRGLDAALSSEAEAIVLTGGTGISARDVTPEAVRARLDREIPGFGQLFRLLSFEQVGAAAMLSSALAGTAGSRVIFALPGSVKAVSLAMERLILPEILHIAGELAKEAPAPEAPAALRPASTLPVRSAAPKPQAGVHVRADEPLDAPRPAAAPDAPTVGWQAGLAALGGSFVRGAPFDPPAALPQGAIDVLASAGERALLTTSDGARWTAFGFPDLVRAGSKVLIVRDTEPVPEIVALHRWPQRVGVCAEDAHVLPSSDVLAGEAEARCGAAFPGEGGLLAVDSSAVYAQRGARAARWDGSRRGEEAPTSSTIASLVLQWSQR